VVAYDPIQGQGHGGKKVVEMVDFKVYLQRYACVHKTYGKLRYSKTMF